MFNIGITTNKQINSLINALGFTVNVVGDEERVMPNLFLKTLADSMRPKKLRRNLETLHPSDMQKPFEFFQRKIGEYYQQKKHFVKSA